MGAFLGTLNANEIFAGIFNMIISQQVYAKNIAGTFGSLVERARVDGSLYGDTKLYYDTDALKSRAWGGDNEAANLLSINRPADPECQAIELNVFRQIDITVDYYLTKRAWMDEGAFSSFTAVVLGWIRDTKRIYDATTYNAYIGTHVSGALKNTITVTPTYGTDTSSADLEGAARIKAESVAKALADLFIELKDVSRDFNDYQHLKSYDLEDLVVVWNSAIVNEIKKLDLPTMFHKEGLIEKFEDEILPSRYFGDLTAASHTVAVGEDYRAIRETEITVGGTPYHLFAGDQYPVGAVIAAGDGYQVNSDIICVVMHKDAVPFMSAFEVGTSFFNPRSLTENHYLTWGHNELEGLYHLPFIRLEF